MSITTKSPSGIGVIDTTTLWAAAKVLIDDNYNSSLEPYNYRIRGVHASPDHYFASLLHCLVLYDELRTDLEILMAEPSQYMSAVNKIIADLSPAIKISAMPDSIKHTDVALNLLPVFIETTQRKAANKEISQDKQFQRLSRHVANLDSPSYRNGAFLYTSDRTEIERARLELRQLAESPLIRSALGDAIDDNQSLLERDLNIIARSVRYSAHSSSIRAAQGVPSAFNAAPARLRILRDYMTADKLAELTFGAEAYTSLFSNLGLPSSGYDFSMFPQSINPLPLSDLWLAVRHMSPVSALQKVLELRATEAGQELRGIWADRLWKRNPHVMEGSSQIISNTSARDIYQIIMTPVDPTVPRQARTAPSTRGIISRFLGSRKEQFLREAILNRIKA